MFPSRVSCFSAPADPRPLLHPPGRGPGKRRRTWPRSPSTGVGKSPQARPAAAAVSARMLGGSASAGSSDRKGALSGKSQLRASFSYLVGGEFPSLCRDSKRYIEQKRPLRAPPLLPPPRLPKRPLVPPSKAAEESSAHSGQKGL